MQRSKGAIATGAPLAAGLELRNAVEDALEAWRGAGTGMTVAAASEAEIGNLPTRFPEACLILRGRSKSADGVGAQFVCGEQEVRAAFGLEPDGPLLPFALGFLRVLEERIGTVLGGGGIAFDAEEGTRLTPEAIAASPFAGATSAFQVTVSVGEGASLAGYLLVGGGQSRARAGARAAAETRADGRRVSGEAGAGDSAPSGSLDIIMDVELPLVVRLGEAEMTLEELLRLRPGSIVELDKQVNEPAELIVNNKVVAYGEVVVIHENFGVRIIRLAHPASENIRLVA